VLRRPVELAAVTGEVELAENQLSGKTTYQDLQNDEPLPSQLNCVRPSFYFDKLASATVSEVALCNVYRMRLMSGCDMTVEPFTL
jgi:hypothetical protein